ncbi:hypothetical protein PVK06_017500 [Gossypium arboreum]|uniref:Uncharacterized protein n=1 Tax=Gossypium arboreum TaxID=29729 RepID=A0ABR0Q3L6_GOSAR|nr:hypothetical protein PVK06_017500 [Gossypium arboreum]
MQRTDSLVKGDFIAGQEEPVVDEEVVAGEEEVLIADFVGATIDNLERDGARPTEAIEEATDDAGVESELKERSEDYTKPKEKKRECFKDKKHKKDKKKTKKRHRTATSVVVEN